MTINHASDRDILHFSDEVNSHFLFLQTIGLRLVLSEADCVRFESSNLAVNIFYERQSYEISLAIENKVGGDSYSLSELLRLVHHKRADNYRDYATHTKEGVVEGVKQLADLFRECVSTGIFSESELFSRLKQQREEIARNYALETQLVQARRKSEVAWRKKDYAVVVEVLKPFRAALTPAEVGKLEFAEKTIAP